MLAGLQDKTLELREELFDTVGANCLLPLSINECDRSFIINKPSIMKSVTLINIFSVSAEIEAEFLESWHKTAEQMKQQPGFIDTKLHQNLADDGKYKYINVAHWETVEAFKTAQANVEIFERQLDIEAIPDLYSVEAEY